MLSATEVERLLGAHGLEARRSLGQNFVADPQLIERIVALAAVGAGDQVVEVGPGLGSLTLALEATGARVIAVEKDDALAVVLRGVLAERGSGAAEVVVADALEVDWRALLQPDQPRWDLIANLPYNVAVPIILSVLQDAPAVQRMLVMVQLEVAERLAAEPGGRTIGIPTVKLNWYARARIVGHVPPEVFVPRPKIDSALVEIVRHDPPATDLQPDEVMRLVRTAYGRRRKMLRSSLSAMVTEDVLTAAGVAPTERPERLDLDDWCRLARARRAADELGQRSDG